jgi:Nif-specific regulatory protein
MGDGGYDRSHREREIYRRCLELFRAEDPSPLVRDTLELLRGFVDAEHGYIELHDIVTGTEQTWSAASGLDDETLEVVRERISRGVIAEAIVTGRVVHVPSAMLDERFGVRESVRRGKIEAVLCIPLTAEGLSGVVYLQAHAGGGPFGDEDVACAQTVAQFVASVGRMLLELLRRRRVRDVTVDIRGKLKADAVLGRSAALARVLERVAAVAPLEANVLLTGPSGSGKSMLARVLHDNSRRSAGPFIEINAAAIQETMLEAELFGALAGAFTGAPQKGLPGKVAAAQGGTLFLDEIGELRPELQAKLLQLAQSRQYYPVGSTAVRTADVRIVAATNRDLPKAIASGAFREDLFHRIKGVEIKLPPLDARREDVPSLAIHLCERFCRDSGVPPMGFSPAALVHLELAPWPGNVRELENRCRDAVVNARVEGSTTIELRHLFTDEASLEDEGRTFRHARQQWERAFLVAELRRREWNVSLTADELEMSRSHLNALIKRYGLSREGA